MKLFRPVAKVDRKLLVPWTVSVLKSTTVGTDNKYEFYSRRKRWNLCDGEMLKLFCPKGRTPGKKKKKTEIRPLLIPEVVDHVSGLPVIWNMFFFYIYVQVNTFESESPEFQTKKKRKNERNTEFTVTALYYYSCLFTTITARNFTIT